MLSVSDAVDRFSICGKHHHQHRIFAYDRRQMELSIENGQTGVHLLEETLNETMKVAVGISPVSKIPDLTGKINRFIAELRADGTLDDMLPRGLKGR
ncbi:MAG: hypothetical protein IKN04_12540 [Clostridia bacterium]|nr:hypothetical protein [Clostridia bacterium]